MKRINQSLFFKLLLLITGSTGIILLIYMAVSTYYLRQYMLNAQKRFYSCLAKQAALRIDIQFMQAEFIVNKAATVFKTKPITKENSLEVMFSILKGNSMLKGSAIALAPDQDFNAYGFQMLYSWKEKGKILTANRLSPEKDYQSEWFKRPYKLKKSIWTSPYLDTDMNKMMITYSVPVIIDKKVIAILTCDMILDSIQTFLSCLELGRKGKPLLITNKGRIVLYADKKQIIGKAETANFSDPALRNTIKRISDFMCSHQNGELRIKQINREGAARVYFDTIRHLNWHLGFIIPEVEIYQPVDRLNIKMLVIAVLGIISLVFPAFLIALSITKPLRALCKAAEALAKGDFSVNLPKPKNDEIGMLVKDFDRMRIDLENYIRTLAETTAEKERIAGELAIAKNIQHGILPKIFPPFPRYPGLDIFARLDSAREVGGDFYDFYIIDDKLLYICIGDVSGKGVPASLFMAIGKTLLKSAVISLKDPAKALSHVNNELAENNKECMFITVFCGIFNLKNNELLYANAGHNPPLVIHREKSRYMENACAPPIGALRNIEFTNSKIVIPSDAKLLLYTDGVTEAMNDQKRVFGMNTLLDLVKTKQCATAEKYIVLIIDAIKEFTKDTEQYDDITLLCFSHDFTISELKRTASIVLANHKSEYKRLAAWIDEVGKKFKWKHEVITQLNLVLEEWFVNVVSYAFKDTDTHEIEIHLRQEKNIIEIQVIDDGIPFDPTSHDIFDLNSSLESREIGGLGIHFIKTTLTSFSYERKNNLNIITMIKELDDET